MLGRLYIKKVAAVQGSSQGVQGGMSSGGNQDPMNGSYEHQIHPWGKGRMKHFGRFDSARPELAVAHAAQKSQRVAIPPMATHRDMFGNFYIREADGTYGRLAKDPGTGNLRVYPINEVVGRDGVSGIYAHGRGETRESRGGKVVRVEEALGLTDVAKARAAGASHVDQNGQFYTSGAENMVPMDQANPEMAKNYRANGMTPPMVDKSLQSTNDRWRADPANAQAVATKERRDLRLKNPAYQAQVNAMYAQQGIPASQRPAWLNTPASPEAYAQAKAQVEASAAAAPTAAPATTAAVAPGVSVPAPAAGETPSTTAAITPGIDADTDEPAVGGTPATTAAATLADRNATVAGQPTASQAPARTSTPSWTDVIPGFKYWTPQSSSRQTPRERETATPVTTSATAGAPAAAAAAEAPDGFTTTTNHTTVAGRPTSYQMQTGSPAGWNAGIARLKNLPQELAQRAAQAPKSSTPTTTGAVAKITPPKINTSVAKPLATPPVIGKPA